jgi:hypothetical protein
VRGSGCGYDPGDGSVRASWRSLSSCPMAHNPHAPQGPDPSQDPAGSTQMFRAFVDEESGGASTQRGADPQRGSSGPRVGVIVGVVALVVIVAAAVWLAMA